MTGSEPPAPGTSFLANVNIVFLTYVANAALAFGVAIVVARALGPEGRGVYALVLLSASIAQAILSLGMGVAAVYELGKGSAPVARVIANTQQVVIFSAAMSGALVLLAWPLFGDRLLDEDVPFWAFAFVVPLFVNYNVLTAVLQGMSRFRTMNVVIVTQPFVLLLVLVGMEAFGDVDPTAALVAWSIGTLVAVLLALGLLRSDLSISELVRIDGPSLRRQVSFGLKGQLGNLVQLLNYRLDQYIVLLFVSTAGVGIYAVSVTLSQAVWFGANAVATVLLPRLTAAGPEEAARTTPLVCRSTLFVSALSALGLAAVSPWLVEGLFGSDFKDALAPLLWLLPGTVALAGSKILASYLLSRGQPLINSGVTVVALAVTLAADFVLIPPFGLTGAAIASSLAYLTHFGLSLVAYARFSGNSIVDAVVIRRDDVRALIETARRRLPVSPP